MLPKQKRITRTKEITFLKSSRQYSARTSLLSLKAVDNKLAHPRLIVITSKKLGNAVKRNSIRRKIVNAYKEIENAIMKPVDILIYPQVVLTPSPTFGGLRSASSQNRAKRETQAADYKKELLRLLDKCDLI